MIIISRKIVVVSLYKSLLPEKLKADIKIWQQERDQKKKKFHEEKNC